MDNYNKVFGLATHLSGLFIRACAPTKLIKFMLQVVELATFAYENTTAPEIKAESCYLKARVYHATGSLNEAKLLYNEACNLWPKFPLAQYGRAQMLVNEGNTELAMKALDAVLEEVPDNQVCL